MLRSSTSWLHVFLNSTVPQEQRIFCECIWHHCEAKPVHLLKSIMVFLGEVYYGDRNTESDCTILLFLTELAQEKL